MEKRKVTFSEEELYPRAKEHFLRNCGIRTESQKHRRMLSEGLLVREKGVSGIHVRALVSYVKPDGLTDKTLSLCGQELTCNAFSKIRQENLLGAYLYMITAGECRCGREEPISDQLFADVWGTAYVDAGREKLEEWIARDVESRKQEGGGEEYALSASFGPGFYGMPTRENNKLAVVLACDEIGVEVKESGIMIPLKSCSGLFLIVKEKEELPAAACMDCSGSPSGCAFCHLQLRTNTERKNRDGM